MSRTQNETARRLAHRDHRYPVANPVSTVEGQEVSRADREYERRGCAIGAEIVTAADSLLVATEAAALFLHWQKMALITLQAEPLDLDKLQYCILRLRYWQERMSEKA